jgi:hypothetical protein
MAVREELRKVQEGEGETGGGRAGEKREEGEREAKKEEKDGQE